MKKKKTLSTKIDILEISRLNIDDVLDKMGTSKEGLTNIQVSKKREKYGENVIKSQVKLPWFIKLMMSFFNPFNLVLMLIGGISFVTEFIIGQDESALYSIAIMGILILVSGFLQFKEEKKSDDAFHKLKGMVKSNTTVKRKGELVDIDIKEIVPGDVLNLSAGDMFPADIRIIYAKDLFVSESSLTGESIPVEKYATLNEEKDREVECSNLAFMGTNIISGAMQGIVINTGRNTYLGNIAKDLSNASPKSSFERGVSDVSKILLVFMAIMLPIIFLINGFSKHDWLGALLFALSVAVGLTPSLLPVIMTSTLAKGASDMAKRKTIVKNLSSIQNFGAINILCTDKTGTLTEDMIVLEKYMDPYGNESTHVLRYAYLNSYFQTGLKDAIDNAIINRAELEEISIKDVKKVDEIPFDFNRRRMSIVIDDERDNNLLITKGSVVEMLSICKYIYHYETDETLLLTEKLKKEIMDRSEELHKKGLRVLVIAIKSAVPGINNFSVKDESDMVMAGFIGFLDPPKESSKQAIKALNDHGIRVVVLTGDHPLVATSVLNELDLNTDNVLTGAEVAKMNDDQLKIKLSNTNLFARLSPDEKKRVIRVFQELGNTVGYMGDGINDAPAMKQADVSISVDSAVDIAKETADVILLEKDLMVLEEGVILGRITFGNIIKYLKMATSSNFGNMFSVLLASIFLPFLPMLPIHILVQNLLYDTSQTTIPFDNVDEDDIKKPKKWDAKGLVRFMYFFGPVSSFFDILSFVVLFFIIKANTVELAPLFQTGWFLLGLLTQTLIVHSIRTKKVPFIDSNASAPLFLSTVIICVIALIIPYTGFGHAIGFVSMKLVFFPWLIMLIISYFVAVQLMKRLYIKIYNDWL